MPPVCAKNALRSAAAILMVPSLLMAAELPVELARSQNGDLTLILTESGLRVEGATAGGEVAYLGASLVEEHESWGRLNSYSGLLADTDGSGQTEFTPKGGISQASVWVVIDLASGAVVGASPDSFHKSLPNEMNLELSSKGDAVSVDRSDLEFLLYRPGLGIWFGKEVSSDDGDQDGVGGGLRLAMSAFRPLRAGGAAAPAHLRPGDRLLAIDLDNLDSANVTFR